MQKYKRDKCMLACNLDVLHFYRAKPVSEKSEDVERCMAGDRNEKSGPPQAREISRRMADEGVQKQHGSNI